VLNLGLVAALVAVGITAHSLAVLAEGSDYLLDAAGVAVALLAIRLSARPANPARPSPTDIAALVNCGWLLALEILVVAAAAERLISRTPEVHGLPVLIVSGVAALAMTAGALVLRADTDDGDAQSSSRSSATKARSRLITPTSPLRIPPPSGCPPRTMAPGTTRLSGRT
jgi:Co/Zn/Cd efflux system component